MATHSSTLAWKMPWMEEPSGLPSDTTEATQSRTQLKRLGSNHRTICWLILLRNIGVVSSLGLLQN